MLIELDQVLFQLGILLQGMQDLSRPLPDCLKPPNGMVMSPRPSC